MQVEILTPVSSIYSGNADSVSLPGLDGVFQVLNGHASIISSLKKGEINMSLSDKFDAEKFTSDQNIKLIDIAKPLRIVLTGRIVPTGIYELIYALGKEDTLTRISQHLYK